ncbi:MAG: hypothetical protein IKP28_06825 [Clostridia bacterium]|nr:hypothetical protein [Clostridia bacterium]
MKTKKLFIKLILLTLISLVTIGTNNIARAEDYQFEVRGISEKYIEWTNLPDEEQENTIEPFINTKNISDKLQAGYQIRFNMLGGTTSAKYDLRDSIKLKVKDQKNTEQCWAFSTTTQLESYYAKVNNKTIEFSPRHIEYSTAKTFSDGINPNGHNREVNDGGNASIAYAYLTSGRGPVLEEDMPFVNTIARIALSEIKDKNVQCQLEEFIKFPQIYKEKVGSTITYSNGETGSDRVVYTNAQVNVIRNQIKEHVAKYGGVSALTAASKSEYYSNPQRRELSAAYYCDNPSVSADHQVTIIGWDDNYSVTNFNSEHRPTSPGAWLVQNSHGNYYDNGTLYISYEDVLVEQAMAGIISLSDIDYDYIYQYDILGSAMSITMGTYSEVYAANVFGKSDKTEYLTEIGIATAPDEDSSYEVYVNPDSGELDSLKYVKVKTLTNITSDYVTVKPTNPIKLTGDSFAVIVKYTGKNGGQAFVPIEAKMTYVYNSAYNTATSNPGESYVSSNTIDWLDMYNANMTQVENINTCIKAFTQVDKENPVLKVSYSPEGPTNKNVTVTITSDEKIQAVPGWTLSSDKKKITKTFANNGSEQVTVTDLSNNKSTTTVTVTGIDKIPPTAQVTYSTKEATNKDVTATITSNEELQNLTGWTLSTNKKSMTKTYTKNTTENISVYDLAGNSKTLSVSISNIDKVLPEILNVKNGEKYSSQVTPISKDNNLDKVELYKNGVKVITYKNGDLIKDAGEYEIIATDKAKNVTKVKFSIIEKIKGDVNGDKKLTITDLLLVKRYMVKLVKFTNEQISIGDMNRRWQNLTN